MKSSCWKYRSLSSIIESFEFRFQNKDCEDIKNFKLAVTL